MKKKEKKRGHFITGRAGGAEESIPHLHKALSVEGAGWLGASSDWHTRLAYLGGICKRWGGGYAQGHSAQCTLEVTALLSRRVALAVASSWQGPVEITNHKSFLASGNNKSQLTTGLFTV